ncbi:hypothetical protein [Ectothiorhodospira variabilis]|uniref:hypothetical protein n=1 Tax=Ectothiorhodospira variabilis TaxID=505694 RepID=UPI001EFBE135|nr:hypothetical protein [Ectothiorhodospira variabilis]MCG5495249.1 hypothetical protein [Ectothiorhodospira variabilis]MCG5504201.1 hypothetical protein [Ectothiorhodospira variabilis]MCG5507356.1 hypothetical protein [Ectothiorhodospira variabilis]
MTTARKLPPYARKILQARQGEALSRYAGTSADGQHPTLWVAIGSEAWDVARDTWERSRPRLMTLCPPGEDPQALDWRCLAGADPALLLRAGAVDGDQVQRLVLALLTARVGRIIDMDTGNRYVRKEVDHAA